ITSISPNVIGYGTPFQVRTPDAANITSVVLMKTGTVTHAFDMDQRMVGLTFTVGSGVLDVTGPPSGNIAPPGYYMLFLLNSTGVPSVAQFVQLSMAPTDIPPTGTITSPTSNVVITPGQSVFFAGSGSATGGSIASYSWAIRGGVPSSSQNPNVGTVTFSNAGVYTASLTVTDNLGITDPSPPTRTISVTTQPAPTLSSVNPNSATQGQSNLSVTITGMNLLPAPICDFGSGIIVNTCAYISTTRISAHIT